MFETTKMEKILEKIEQVGLSTSLDFDSFARETDKIGDNLKNKIELLDLIRKGVAEIKSELASQVFPLEQQLSFLRQNILSERKEHEQRLEKVNQELQLSQKQLVETKQSIQNESVRLDRLNNSISDVISRHTKINEEIIEGQVSLRALNEIRNKMNNEVAEFLKRKKELQKIEARIQEGLVTESKLNDKIEEGKKELLETQRKSKLIEK